jgi:hypothetical protein
MRSYCACTDLPRLWLQNLSIFSSTAFFREKRNDRRIHFMLAKDSKFWQYLTIEINEWI